MDYQWQNWIPTLSIHLDTEMSNTPILLLLFKSALAVACGEKVTLEMIDSSYQLSDLTTYSNRLKIKSYQYDLKVPRPLTISNR